MLVSGQMQRLARSGGGSAIIIIIIISQAVYPVELVMWDGLLFVRWDIVPVLDRHLWPSLWWPGL